MRILVRVSIIYVFSITMSNVSSFSLEEHLVVSGDLNGHVGKESTEFEKIWWLCVCNDKWWRKKSFRFLRSKQYVHNFFEKPDIKKLVIYYLEKASTLINSILVQASEFTIARDVKVIASQNVLLNTNFLLEASS